MRNHKKQICLNETQHDCGVQPKECEKLLIIWFLIRKEEKEFVTKFVIIFKWNWIVSLISLVENWKRGINLGTEWALAICSCANIHDSMFLDPA